MWFRILWPVISVKFNIGKKNSRVRNNTLFPKKSGMFPNLQNWCLRRSYTVCIWNFYKWKFNLIWSCKWITCKRITEHICWSVGTQLTCYINFCMCEDGTPKQLLACVGACECNRTPFIDRPEIHLLFQWKNLGLLTFSYLLNVEPMHI